MVVGDILHHRDDLRGGEVRHNIGENGVNAVNQHTQIGPLGFLHTQGDYLTLTLSPLKVRIHKPETGIGDSLDTVQVLRSRAF